MAWLIVLLFVVFQIVLVIFGKQIGKPPYHPELKDLYEKYGQQKINKALYEIKHSHPRKPKLWAIQKLRAGIRKGTIKL